MTRDEATALLKVIFPVGFEFRWSLEEEYGLFIELLVISEDIGDSVWNRYREVGERDEVPAKFLVEALPRIHRWIYGEIGTVENSRLDARGFDRHPREPAD